MFSSFLESRISVHIVVTWQDKCQMPPNVPLPPPSPSSAFFVEDYIVWYGLLLWSSGVSCPGCISPQQVGRHQNFHIFPISTPRLLASSVTYKFHQCSATHWCVINTGLGTSSKRSTIQASVNKIKNLCQLDPL